MKKPEENKQEVNNDLLDDLYDIENLKNDLDEVLNLEGITVSESLIQATLKKASETKEENIIPFEEKITRKKRGIPFHYGMIAACACILFVVGIKVINSPFEMMSSKEDKVSMDGNNVYNSTESEGMDDSDTTTETTEDSTDSSVMPVPLFFDIVDEDSNSYPVEVTEIEQIVVHDENDETIYKGAGDMDSSYIENVYEEFANIDNQENIEVVQNEENKGQYVRQYDIIAHDGLAWSELHLWIASTDQETYIITRQLITSDGEVITHQITDVSPDIIKNIINAIP